MSVQREVPVKEQVSKKKKNDGEEKQPKKPWKSGLQVVWAFTKKTHKRIRRPNASSQTSSQSKWRLTQDEQQRMPLQAEWTQKDRNKKTIPKITSGIKEVQQNWGKHGAMCYRKKKKRKSLFHSSLQEPTYHNISVRSIHEVQKMCIWKGNRPAEDTQVDTFVLQ